MKTRTLVIVILALLLLAAVLVRSHGGGLLRSLVPVLHGAQAASQSVAGRWGIEAPDTPHGKMTMSLVLEQKGKDVTGTLSIPHAGEFALTGEFADRTLTLRSSGRGHGDGMTLSATLKDDGTLVGYTSTERGDVKWTGKRQ